MTKRAVAYIVKGSHTQLLAVSLVSLLKHYDSNEALDILLVEDATQPIDKALLQQLPKYYNKKHVTVRLCRPPRGHEKTSDVEVEIDQIVLWRLFLSEEYQEYDQILYIDNDTLIYCDVHELFERLEPDDMIAAVPDFFFYVQSDQFDLGSQYGLKSTKHYVNAGVIVFNTQRFREAYPSERILELILNNAYPWPDQTLLNIMCEDHISILPLEYNYQKNDAWLYQWALGFSPDSAQEIVEARNNIKIRHFIEYESLSMPWEHLFVENQQEMDFWNYLHEVKTLDFKHRHAKHGGENK